MFTKGSTAIDGSSGKGIGHLFLGGHLHPGGSRMKGKLIEGGSAGDHHQGYSGQNGSGEPVSFQAFSP